jgi:lysophospholipase L1-like esterase
MRCAAIAIALLPFVIAELVLRRLEPNSVQSVDDDPLVDLHQLRPLFVLNEQKGRWEIPPQRANYFAFDSFVADKPPGLKRIFVLGGSTVQGHPYSIETAFPTWLKLRLQAANPDTPFEVVNCGGVSYASYRVARLLDEVLQHQPDAIVLYTGHNEFLEDREYREVKQLGSIRYWISRIASPLRLVKWIQNQLPHSDSSATVLASEVDTRLDHVGGLDRYQRDPDWKSGVEQHFDQTLRRMIRTADSAGVPLVLCVPACDLVTTPPFKVVPSLQPGTSAAAEFDEAWRCATDGSLTIEQRLQSCQQCLKLDPLHAGAAYVAGRLSFELGDSQQASPLLVAARDLDVCPLRATSPIVDSVIDASRQFDIPLVQTELLLDQRDSQGRHVSDGIADPEYFVDHVHPSVAGHQQIAQAVFGKLAELGWYPQTAEAESRYQQLAKQHLDSLGEAYYARGKQRLEGLRRWASGRSGSKLSIDELLRRDELEGPGQSESSTATTQSPESQ